MIVEFLGSDLYEQRDEPPKKVSKLAVQAEMESDKYDTHTSVICYGCGGKEVERTTGNVDSPLLSCLQLF